MLVFALLALPLGVSLGLWWFNSRAERRARQLFQAVLTQEQYRHLLQRGYLYIRSPSHQRPICRRQTGSCRYMLPGALGSGGWWLRRIAPALPREVMDRCVDPVAGHDDGFISVALITEV